MLAYSVGFGGSMVWFGSSAGVALSNLYPESRSVASGSGTAGTSLWPTWPAFSLSSSSWAGSPGSSAPRGAAPAAVIQESP